ncbi:uncharacterized protein G2W53_024904 [Senna tora]|uniref:Uncharacterized protein n=1 Tax=Senna tora TaxID=362788 RepID=A0A834TL03_9FABA|nr:uncharacterized protein G2W53_024904 [Senna tora]
MTLNSARMVNENESGMILRSEIKDKIEEEEDDGDEKGGVGAARTY